METVLILDSSDVLARAIKSQLKCLDISCVVSIPANNVDAIIQEVRRFQPKVVVMVDHLLSSMLPLLINLLSNTPEYRIVVVRLQDNKVHVYHKRELILTEGTNLVTALQGS